jgi:hypothetical protein
MRRYSTVLLFALVCAVPAFVARADEPAPAAPVKTEKTQPERVHLGSASVTVVDEHETVDDVISRIRDGKAADTASDKAKTTASHDQGARTVTATETRPGSGRSSLRAVRDRANARAEADRIKDERRERAASTRTRLEQRQHR